MLFLCYQSLKLESLISSLNIHPDTYNLSFGFCRYENRQGLEANFVDLFEGNSQVAVFENKSAKFDREITYFRVKKPKTQV
jgi:hypothetical protein